MWAYGDHSYSNHCTERGGLFSVAAPGNGTNTEDQQSPTKHHLWSSDMCFSFKGQSRGGVHNSEVLLKLRPTQPTSEPSLSWFRVVSQTDSKLIAFCSLIGNTVSLCWHREPCLFFPIMRLFREILLPESFVSIVWQARGKGRGAVPASLELLLDYSSVACLVCRKCWRWSPAWHKTPVWAR